MLDVGRLQKVNELARTLRSQGIAADHEEATALASEIAGSQDEQAILGGVHGSRQQEVVLVQQPQPQEFSGSAIAVVGYDQAATTRFNAGNYYTREQVEMVLQKFADQVCSEVNKLTEQLQQQQKAMNTLYGMMDTLKKGAVITQSKEEEQTKLNVPNTVKEVVSEQKKPSETPHPRSGAYTPNDVAIDKFFYFGSK